MTGRVVIDTLSFVRQYGGVDWISVVPLRKYGNNSNLKVHNNSESVASTATSEPTRDKGAITNERPSAERQRVNKDELLNNRQYLLLMKPTLPGYSIQLKKWSKFSSLRL